MDEESLWEEYYRKTPLEKIPWQKTQADYFTKIIKSGRIKPGKAIDLGCGAGGQINIFSQKGL